jgi:hypothetical protein
MAMNHYNVRRGFIAEASAGTVPEWSAHAPGYLHEDYNPPCLVVTGNLAAARARLEATTPDDVKQAAVDALSTFASIKLRPISWAEAVNALADAGLLRGPETSSAAPEGAALSASGTVRRAGGPDHGTAPVGDDCTSVIASALRDIYAAHGWDSGDDAVPDASAITFALCEAFGWEYLCDLRVDTSERPSVVAPLSADDAERFFRYRYDYVARSPENAPSGTWTDAQVDGLARHLYLVENGGPKPWAELAEETQDVWRSRARRALAAVEEARDA